MDGSLITTFLAHPSLAETPLPVSYTNDALRYTGNWTQLTNDTAWTSDAGASVSLNFTGVAVAIEGPSGTEKSFGTYYVVR